MQSIVICAVDVYALISGFVGYSENADAVFKKYSKGIKLWLQVLFYSVVLYCIVSICNGVFSLKEFLKACLPVTTNQYWYFSAYAAVIISAPWINRMLARLDGQELKMFTTVFFGLIIGYIPVVGILYDPFKIQGGYSAVWLVLLYILGALLKKNVFSPISNWKMGALAIVMLMMTFVVKLITPRQNVLLTYTSPTVLIFAICMVLLFSRLKLNMKTCAGKLATYVGGATFGVYLIHDNNLVREFLIHNQFMWILDYSKLLTPMFIVIGALVIFVVALVIELIRQKLFRVLLPKIYYLQ